MENKDLPVLKYQVLDLMKVQQQLTVEQGRVSILRKGFAGVGCDAKFYRSMAFLYRQMIDLKGEAIHFPMVELLERLANTEEEFNNYEKGIIIKNVKTEVA